LSVACLHETQNAYIGSVFTARALDSAGNEYPHLTSSWSGGGIQTTARVYIGLSRRGLLRYALTSVIPKMFGKRKC
jgi:hypothetical protein